MRSETRDSFTRVARREQIVRATIETVAEAGLANASLSRIADRIGISKGSILYHFDSRDRLIEAAVTDVYQRIAASVGDEVGQATSARDAVRRYILALVEHLDTHRVEVRVITEAFSAPQPSPEDREHANRRWGVLAEILDAAFDERGADSVRPDTEVMAISISGAIDALVGRAMSDPDFDLPGAGATLAGLSDQMIHP